MHIKRCMAQIKRWRPCPMAGSTTLVNSAFGATAGRAAKNGRLVYARGVFHEETTQTTERISVTGQ